MTRSGGVLVDWPATWRLTSIEVGAGQDTHELPETEALRSWLTFTRAVHRLAPLSLATWQAADGDPFAVRGAEPDPGFDGWSAVGTVGVPALDVPLERLAGVRAECDQLVVSRVDDAAWPAVRHVLVDDVVVARPDGSTSRPAVVVEHCVARDGDVVDLVVRVSFTGPVGLHLADCPDVAAVLVALADACASSLRPAAA